MKTLVYAGATRAGSVATTARSAQIGANRMTLYPR